MLKWAPEFAYSSSSWPTTSNKTLSQKQIGTTDMNISKIWRRKRRWQIKTSGKKMNRHPQNKKKLKRIKNRKARRRRIRARAKLKQRPRIKMSRKLKRRKNQLCSCLLSWRIRLRRCRRSSILIILPSATFGCTSYTPSSATRPAILFQKNAPHSATSYTSYSRCLSASWLFT